MCVVCGLEIKPGTNFFASRDGKRAMHERCTPHRRPGWELLYRDDEIKCDRCARKIKPGIWYFHRVESWATRESTVCSTCFLKSKQGRKEMEKWRRKPAVRGGKCGFCGRRYAAGQPVMMMKAERYSITHVRCLDPTGILLKK
jgi:hypothetical protein